MRPILLKLGPVTVYAYGVMLVLAFLLSVWWARRAARRLPPECLAIAPAQMIDFASLSLLGGIVGGRLLYILLNWAFFVQAPQELLAIWHGGLVWYGGFLGGVAAGAWYARANQLVFLRVLDQFIPFLAFGHAIGRLGCFLNGCCYGEPTASWCGVRFPGHPVPVVPTQLLESAGLLLLAALLRALQRPPVLRRAGRLFGIYLVGYAALRLAVEFVRGDQAVVWAGLTLAQLISLAAFAVGAWLVCRKAATTP